MNNKTQLKARDIERLENTSVAAALAGAEMSVADTCSGICVGVICSLFCYVGS